MKPLFSDDERIKTVKNFVVARYQGLVKISSFNAMIPYLTEKRIKILCTLPQTGSSSYVDISGKIHQQEENCYREEDAEKYFEWLVAVVTGVANVSEDIVKKANDQLFQFIHVMRDNIHTDKNVQLVTPYDWQALFTSFDERLTDIQRIIDKSDKDTVETLKSILQWMKKYNPILDALDKENQELFGKGKKK